MEETGLDDETAACFAAAIGDTPETDDEGLWTATLTLDGWTISISPPVL
jgi:hypothetical protein